MRRFTAPRRAAFLVFYGKTGNWTASARAVGIDRSTADQRRRRDAQFALDCLAAKEASARLLTGARDCFDGVDDPELQTIKRGPHGRAMIVAARKGKWCKSTEEVVLAVLRHCGNVAAAARAAGIAEGTIWTRRREWPAFRTRMEEALEEAEIVLEFRLATMGNDVPGDEGEGGGEGDAQWVRPSTSPGTNEVPAIPFDPDLALRFLKWREQKRTGPTGRRARLLPRPRGIEEVRDSIRRKVAAIKHHDDARKLAEGWSRDEATDMMIPPGWVRKAPDGDGGDDRAGDGDSP